MMEDLTWILTRFVVLVRSGLVQVLKVQPSSNGDILKYWRKGQQGMVLFWGKLDLDCLTFFFCLQYNVDIYIYIYSLSYIVTNRW